MGITPSGHFAKLYQFLVREPDSLPAFDTRLVGSFLPYLWLNDGRTRLHPMAFWGFLQNCVAKSAPSHKKPARTAKVAVRAGLPLSWRETVSNDFASSRLLTARRSFSEKRRRASNPLGMIPSAQSKRAPPQICR